MRASLILLLLLLSSFQLDAALCEYSVRDLSYSLHGKAHLELTKSKRRYRRFAMNLSARESASLQSEILSYRFELFESLVGERKQAKPLIILFPTINGVGALEAQMARYLAGKGMHVLVPHARVERFDDSLDPAYQMDLELARAICGVELVMDHREDLFTFDITSMAVIGASQGGIRGTTLFNRRAEMRALVTSVAASNLPLVYAQSTQVKIENFKNRLLALLGLEQNDQLEQLLSEQLLIDPSDQADPSRSSQVWMLISVKDTVVPTQAQLELWEQMGRPKRQLLDASHGLSVVRLHLMRKQVFEFIQKQL